VGQLNVRVCNKVKEVSNLSVPRPVAPEAAGTERSNYSSIGSGKEGECYIKRPDIV
jgi:hypothetical protein